MGFFDKAFTENSRKAKQQNGMMAAENRGAIDGGNSLGVKSDEHLSDMGQRYYRDPYEYMRNFLREFREAEKLR
jgi:hypothetical protein